MTSVSPFRTTATRSAAPVFPRILCGVNGSRAANEAMRQAVALAFGGALVHFVAVCDARGIGATETAEVGEHRAEEALALAHETARDADVRATTELVHASDPRQRLVALAGEYDLLVVGGHGHSRAAEIALCRTAGLAAHSASSPVLIARPAEPFPGSILAATDARVAGRRIVELAARLAREHGSPLTLVHAGDHTSEERRELAEQAAMAREVTGADPVVACEPRHAVERILAVAERDRPGLVVIGSGGRTGLKALGSVSERVAMRARCSVLIMRHSAEMPS